MAAALSLEKESLGGFPKDLRSPPRHHRLQQQKEQQFKLTASHSPRTDSSAELVSEEPHCCCLQDCNQAENEVVGGDLLKVLERLDDIIERLTKSCNVKPDIELHAGDGCHHHLYSGEEPINARVFEDRLDRIIQRLSQREHCSRKGKEELCTMLPKAKPEDTKLGRYLTPNPSSRASPVETHGFPVRVNVGNPMTPTSPCRIIALLTPRSLLPKFGSSPTTGGLSCGRSGRFAAAFSFLASPGRAGVTSFRVGSPNAYDGFMER